MSLNLVKLTKNIDAEILVIDKIICRHIDSLSTLGRGAVSQDILAQLRNFIEYISLKIYASNRDIEVNYSNIIDAINFVKTRGDLKFLRRFHTFLQIMVSHYTVDEERSERLMLKYYEYLLRTKNFLEEKYSFSILENIDKFPLHTDPKLAEYYEKIAVEVKRARQHPDHYHINDRYYVFKTKPFFVNHKIYYEVTFTRANEKASKFDRVIAFTDIEIPRYYAARLFISIKSINLLNMVMPIHIIVNWETSIRPCEIRNFSKLVGEKLTEQGGSVEYRSLMHYLTKTGFSLVELLDFPDSRYQETRTRILERAKTDHFFSILDKCRKIISEGRDGSNVIRYLLLHLSNRIIKNQWDVSNNYLSGLCLSNKCIPFDKMPFNSSLVRHNPMIADVFECIDSTDRKHELFARFISNNTVEKGQLYTPIEDASGFGEIDTLMNQYNSLLWSGHTSRRIELRKKHIYIREYEEDTIFILQRLSSLSQKGIRNYSSSVKSWLRTDVHIIDCEEKKAALIRLFNDSKVALIYGSAGTGKSTMINHISHLFSDDKKLYLTNTNPAIDNLKRKVNAANCTFSTITSFLENNRVNTEYGVLVIDECSTVSNSDMKRILTKTVFDLIVLTGDVFQIEAIRFGNWFDVARSFIPETSVFELTKPYRSNNKNLLELWNRVRVMDDTVLEIIQKGKYSLTLDESIFEKIEDDEIVLLLNYDGLYGINNINRFLQQNNSNKPVRWGNIHVYKIGDPVLFNESNRFAPLIYNNMKGQIADIEIQKSNRRIRFDIELDKVINERDAQYFDFELLENSESDNSVIRFFVNEYPSSDEDDDSSSAIVPFQIAYAISIHKAQGLEYNSVKIVITNEIDELITHSIFYTAITRAREHLKIYWTPEVEQRVLSRLKPKDYKKDVTLLKSIV